MSLFKHPRNKDTQVTRIAYSDISLGPLLKTLISKSHAETKDLQHSFDHAAQQWGYFVTPPQMIVVCFPRPLLVWAPGITCESSWCRKMGRLHPSDASSAGSLE
ncbi:hypothetical protein RRG08_062784 [Elysia crispata]|uniref:Uncharacterized protein n=1 Tax=Elysia crispata TaxID=231223 RepID=A0AAE1ARP6_9GAST|nr:hypothetical protein RRG08_062784 [Elysia crispata]